MATPDEILKKYGFTDPGTALAPPGPTALSPTEFGKAKQDLSSIQTSQSKERDAARLRATLATAPDFDTYLKISNEISDLETAFAPREVAEYAGAPSRKQGEQGILGVPALNINASPQPLDVSSNEALGPLDLFRPQTRVGPIVQEELETTGKLRERGNMAFMILPEDAVAEVVKSKPEADRVALIEDVAASRAMIRKLAEDNPTASQEDIYKMYSEQHNDIDSAMRGEGKLGVTTQEPGKAPNLAEAIYARQTTPGSVPNLTAGQRAYLDEYYAQSYSRRKTEAEKSLRTQLTSELIPNIQVENLTEEQVAAGAAGVVKPGTRYRTPKEVEEVVRTRLPDEIVRLQLPWWIGPNREAILANPEKYAVKKPLIYGGQTVYPTGATRENIGAFALRVGMAPANVLTSGMATGAARFGELAGGRAWDDKSIVGEAREKRGGKAADLPDDWVGDLAEAVMLGKGGTQTTGDIYEAVGLPRIAGNVLGFGLDILTPPYGGLPSAGGAGVKAFSAVRAIEAAGLFTKETAAVAGIRAASGALRDAWTWRKLGAGATESLLPGSLRIAAAEETGKAFGFRTALREELAAGNALDEATIYRIAAEHEATFGKGKWLTDYERAVANGEVEKFARELADDVADIPDKGHYLSGTRKLLTEADRITTGVMDATKSAELTEPLLRAVLQNAASRSGVLMDLLKANPGKNVASLLEEARRLDPAAVRAAAPSVAAFDALTSAAANSKGFQTFKDLVLISNRHIGSPEGAIQAMEAAEKTDIGRRLGRITEDLESGGATVEYGLPAAGQRGVRSDRPVQVVRVTGEEAKEMIEDINFLQNSGFMPAYEADYARSFLLRQGEETVPVSSLRAVAEANLDHVISAKNAGIDIETIAFRPTKAPATVAGRLEAAAEATARINLFTPAQMRSSLDGVYLKAMAFKKSSTAASKVIETPPSMQRAINDFMARAGQADASIRALVKDLYAVNSPQRAFYGLPAGVKLEPIEIMSAIARGPTEQAAAQSSRFVNQAIDLMMTGYEDTSRSFFGINDIWITRSYFSTARDSYFTADGVAALSGLRASAAQALAGGARVDQVMADLHSALSRLTENPTMMAASWRVEQGTVLAASELDKVLGGALYMREVEALKAAVILSSITEQEVASVLSIYRQISGTAEAARKELGGLLEAITGKAQYATLPEADGARMLIYSSMVARAQGYRSAEDLLTTMQVLSAQGPVPSETWAAARTVLETRPDLAEALNNIMPVVNAAADRALARGGLNAASVEDYVTAMMDAAARGGPKTQGMRGTARLIRGAQVQDALEAFVREDIQQQVFRTVAESIPQSQSGFQQAVAAVASATQLMGNVRYNMFLYSRLAYHSVNILTAPFILHSTLGIEGFPKFHALCDAARAMERGPIGKALGAADTAVAFRDAAGRVFTYEDLRDLGLRSGSMKTEQQVLFSGGVQEAIAEEARRMEAASGRSMPKAVVDRFTDVLSIPAEFANSTDNFWRMSSLAEALRQGKPVTVAQEIAKKSLFDFGSLTGPERVVASRFFIFYTFARVSAEQTARMMGSTEGAARFAKQAAVTRDVSALMASVTGDEEFDVRRFYLSDKQFTRVQLAQTQVGSNQFVQLFPSIPSQDSFMTMMGILYAASPVEMVTGTKTGLGQYLDPFLKYAVEQAPESLEYQRRADKLRIMDPRHVAAICNTNSMLPSCMFFGDIAPLNPTRDTTATYMDKEWQLSEAGFQRYKTMAKTAEFMGLTSMTAYYTPLLVGEEKLQLPGKDRLSSAIGVPYLSVVTPEQQEAAVLKKQADIMRQREMQIQKQQETQQALDTQRALDAQKQAQ